jgi:hypothetical protein
MTVGKTIQISGVVRPTPYTKSLIVKAMNAKGEAFVAASILLKQNAPSTAEGISYVTLHLLCQGIEVLLKAFLLAHDFDKYWRRLPTKSFGHDLMKLANEVISAYQIKPIPHDVESELRILNDFYSTHQLRYAGIGDLFVDPGTIGYSNVMHRLKVVFRLERKRGRP